MANAVITRTGTRQEFVCDTCGQYMVRFLAQQVSPPPADVWRFQRADAKVEPPTDEREVAPLEDVAPPPDGLVDPEMEPDYPGP